MKNFHCCIFIICVFFCTVITLTLAINNDEEFQYKTMYIDVPLDHFNYVNNQTFKLRYLINNSFIVEKSDYPILFYTGNEGDIELFAENTGFLWYAAQILNASVIFAEHRYYGKSLPFGDKSFDSPQHLGFLTSEQALADYAHLIKNITYNKNHERHPVIAIGGSYGGMLAAWFRMKYPHLVAGAIAASAPILQFSEDITPCGTFNIIVTSVFSTAYNKNCSDNIKRSWETLKNFSATDKGRNILNTHFRFCKNITKQSEIDDLIDYLEDAYGGLAMGNYPYEANFIAPLPAYPVRMFCGQLSKKLKGEELIIGLQKAINIYANYTGKKQCFNYSTAFETLDASAWDFQSCTEMVMPMCSNGKDDMFLEKKWDFNKFSNDCFKQFGVRPRQYEITTRFPGKQMNGISNILFSNGLLDPWSGGGVLLTPNPKIVVIIIPEGAHHIDLRSANKNDPESVRQARKVELFYMKSWIDSF